MSHDSVFSMTLLYCRIFVQAIASVVVIKHIEDYWSTVLGIPLLNWVSHCLCIIGVVRQNEFIGIG